MKPILLVTCRAGSEEWCENEVGNILFHKDPDVRVVKTKYRGLLIVYSDKLDHVNAYRLLKNYEYGFVSKIIPIYFSSRSLDAVIHFIESNIEKLLCGGETVKLQVRVRGRRNISRIIWDRVKSVLVGKGIIHSPKAKQVLSIDVVDETYYVGLIVNP